MKAAKKDHIGVPFVNELMIWFHRKRESRKRRGKTVSFHGECSFSRAKDRVQNSDDDIAVAPSKCHLHNANRSQICTATHYFA
jgi:hypothetical protein